MLWDKNELKSKEERIEVKARKDKDASQISVPRMTKGGVGMSQRAGISC